MEVSDQTCASSKSSSMEVSGWQNQNLKTLSSGVKYAADEFFSQVQKGSYRTWNRLMLQKTIGLATIYWLLLIFKAAPNARFP